MRGEEDLLLLDEVLSPDFWRLSWLRELVDSSLAESFDLRDDLPAFSSVASLAAANESALACIRLAATESVPHTWLSRVAS